MSDSLDPNRFRFVIREEPVANNWSRKRVLDSPESIYEFYQDVIRTDESFERNKEHLIVLLTNTKHELIGYNVVHVGSLDESIAHPREILRPVLISAAYGFVILHNHPSGDPLPSMADNRFTRRMIEASDLMRVRLLDHIVCGESNPTRQGYYSFREAGIIA